MTPAPTMPAPPPITARVARVTDLTHDVRQIDLCPVDPPEIRFIAGQFVSFSVPKSGLPYPLTRPYSISSSPRETDRFELLLNRVPDGPGSTFLFALRPGDAVQCRPPAGTFLLRDDPDRRLILVAAGTGIAPIRSMLLARLPSPTPVVLLWELLEQRDLYYQEELADLAARHREFSFVTTLTRPSESWTGEVGSVVPLVDRHVEPVGDATVYVCGGSAMIAAVVARVRAHGTCPIHREQYYKDPPGPAA